MSDDLSMLDIPQRSPDVPAPKKCWYVTHGRLGSCPAIWTEYYYRRNAKTVLVVGEESTPEKFARRKEIETGSGTYFFDADEALRVVQDRLADHIGELKADLKKAETRLVEIGSIHREFKSREKNK